jgi:Recombination endonuclease VII
VAATTKKAPPKVCKDCKERPLLLPGATPEPGVLYQPKVPRPAPYPGPRCKTDHLVKRAADRARAHGRRVVTIYGITIEFYWQLYEFQGGKCYICRRATGKTKKLAVDHDHDCQEGHARENACPKCVRGLLCTPCNKDVVGHLRADPDAFLRGAEYCTNPPARQLAALAAA